MSVAAFEDVGQAAQDAALSFAAWAYVGQDTPRETRKRQRLHPYRSGPMQRRQKQTFTAEDRVFYPTLHLNVVFHRRLEGYQAPGIESKRLTGCKVPPVDRPTGVNKRDAVARQPLEDEPFAAKQPCENFLLKCDPDLHPAGCARNASFWQISSPPSSSRCIGMILPG